MCTHLDKTGSTYYFRRPVPNDLVGWFRTSSGKPRTEWKFSLRTKDREEAKRLLRPRVMETDRLIDDARRALEERRALCDAENGEYGADRARLLEEAEAAAVEADARSARYAARREYRVAARQRMALSTAELSSEEAAWRDLVRERDQKLEKLQEAAAGQIEVNKQLGAGAGGGSVQAGLCLLDLFDRYAATGTANPKTARRWRGIVEGLTEYLGHGDARRITRADLNGWTADLVATKGLARKTILAAYVPAARVAFDIAFEDGAIPANPAIGLKIRAPKVAKLRNRDLSDAEAETILRATMAQPPERLSESHARARRWVPWLLAYTGARVGELTQLRPMDIQQYEGIWVVHITPEAGSVKTNEARLVPVHPHLIEQGFLEFANPRDASPLFHEEGIGTDVNPASKMRASDLGKWARKLGVTAPQPNHGWRHRFKTVALSMGIQERTADYIQGHAPSTAGRAYGNDLASARDAIERLPRYLLTDGEPDQVSSS